MINVTQRILRVETEYLGCNKAMKNTGASMFTDSKTFLTEYCLALEYLWQNIAQWQKIVDRILSNVRKSLTEYCPVLEYLWQNISQCKKIFDRMLPNVRKSLTEYCPISENRWSNIAQCQKSLIEYCPVRVCKRTIWLEYKHEIRLLAKNGKD